MDKIEKIRKEVTKLLCTDDSGHGMDHVNRVCHIALSIADENASQDLVAAISLLHDADDYKLFGTECSENLTNTKKILSNIDFSEEENSIIINSIKTIGYSKRLEGITPVIKEAMIVSDADMLDAMGAIGILRSYQYNISHGNPFFDRKEFPILDIDVNVYKNKSKGTVVNHLFEKILRLKGLMLTNKGKDEAIKRYDFLVNFLKEYFYEENAEEWQEFLDDYIKKN